MTCDRCERLERFTHAEDISADFLDAVEREVGMGAGAWDCAGASNVISGVIRAALAAEPEPQETRWATADADTCRDSCVSIAPDFSKYEPEPPCEVCGGSGKVSLIRIRSRRRTVDQMPCPKCGGRDDR